MTAILDKVRIFYTTPHIFLLQCKANDNASFNATKIQCPFRPKTTALTIFFTNSDLHARYNSRHVNVAISANAIYARAASKVLYDNQNKDRARDFAAFLRLGTTYKTPIHGFINNVFSKERELATLIKHSFSVTKIQHI
ncbi:hypothetical protein [Glaciimonas soli]|uniref:Uncharacterized protein n=1 Tax=Glaciimonas soli TaxID=2590999 RepID=A0A843YRC8_9BURK|nr:hypothetical protein [Glaciimonas soli]MQR00284.1 hypothetical protein [Glaciimonas soli]